MHVLFLCPHGAAKSVIATAMLRDEATRHGWVVKVSNAGTAPDETLNPIALAALQARGLDFSEAPRLVTRADIQSADTVVSFGCTLPELPSAPQHFVDWSDAPNASDDIDGLCRYIARRLPELAD